MHQRIVLDLATTISNYLKNSKTDGEVYFTQFDARSSEKDDDNDRITNVVQPDISIVCDKAKLDDKGCKGSPDMIIEVDSSSNAAVDYIYKLNLYNKYKVKEYWIVNPRNKSIMVYRQSSDGEFGESENYQEGSQIAVGILKDLIIDSSMLNE